MQWYCNRKKGCNFRILRLRSGKWSCNSLLKRPCKFSSSFPYLFLYLPVYQQLTLSWTEYKFNFLKWKTERKCNKRVLGDRYGGNRNPSLYLSQTLQHNPTCWFKLNIFKAWFIHAISLFVMFWLESLKIAFGRSKCCYQTDMDCNLLCICRDVNLSKYLCELSVALNACCSWIYKHLLQSAKIFLKCIKQ